MDLEQAIMISCRAHYGQKDLGGKPYIFHPLWVMSRFEDTEHQIVAVLHDVSEDTGGSNEWLRDNLGLTSECYEALCLLTRPKEMEYFEYIERLKFSNNQIAIDVKMADLNHNQQTDRLPSEITDRDEKRLLKYSKASFFLHNITPCLRTYPDRVYPEFIKFENGLAFRRTSVQREDNSYAIYYRDGGKWDIYASFFSDGLYSRWFDINIGNKKSLDMQKMVECTEDEYAENNVPYYKRRK